MRRICFGVFVFCFANSYCFSTDTEVAPLSKSEALSIGKSATFFWNAPVNLNTNTYLVFDARINANNVASGGAPALQLFINKVPITLDYLKNKQTQWIHGTKSFISWANNDTFTVLYHKWDDESTQYGRLHRYVFDIAPLLIAGQKNLVEFKSVFDGVPNAILELRDISIQQGGEVLRHPFPKDPEPLYLSAPLLPYRNKAIARHRGSEAELDTAPDFQDGQLVINAKKPLNTATVNTSFSEEGDLIVDIGELSIPVCLNVGLPVKGWTNLRNESEWTTTILDKNRATYTNDKICIEREIVSFPYGISIHDKITNLSSEDIPVGLLYELEGNKGSKLEEFRLFGTKQPSFYANTIPSRVSSTTPTLYFRYPQGSYGVLIEDNILRNQLSCLAWDNTMAFGTDMFYLQGNSSYEFQWSIIPTSGHDYYDFLNKIRAKWNTYQNIPGLFGFVYPEGKDRALNSSNKIQAFLEDTGITNPCIPPYAKASADKSGSRMIYGNEPSSIVTPILDNVRSFIELAQKGSSHPFLIYTDVHLVRNDGDLKILDELSDSLIMDYRGNPVEYRPGWLYNLLPTEKNSAGNRFLANLGKYMSIPGVQGIFLDEWDHSKARYSFNHPDGNTALLDDKFQIIRKIGIVPLLIKTYQKKVVDFLLSKSAILYANQFDSTQEGTALPIVHFAEPTQYDSYLLRGAQLSRSPLSLTIKRSNDPWRDCREFLKYGVLTCFYAQRLTGDHMLKHVYPITARKIGPGYVISDKRIVTRCSGQYTFGNDRPMVAKVFGGPEGQYLRTISKSNDGSDETYLDLHLNDDNQEAAIIESM